MPDKLTLRLVTPREEVLRVACDEVRAPTVDGSFGVRPGHTAFLALLGEGALTWIEGERQDTWVVLDGFVEVAQDVVVVLADQALRAESADPAAVDRVLAEARRRNGESDESRRLRRDLARVEVASARER